MLPAKYYSDAGLVDILLALLRSGMGGQRGQKRGTPARPVRKLTAEELAELRQAWTHYRDYVAEYRRLGKFHSWADHPLKDR